MRRFSTELLDGLALDCALGLLRGGARRRYERYVQHDEAVARASRAWQRRALSLLSAPAPRAPPPALRDTLSRRLRELVRAGG